MRGSRTEDKTPLHIVSAWCDEEGICFGQIQLETREMKL